MAAAWTVLWLTVSWTVGSLQASPPCPDYGGCQHFPFLPAPPGKTPKCARPGYTFCESIGHYPQHLIKYLVEQWGYDTATLLNNESKDNFNQMKPITYGTSFYHPQNGIYFTPSQSSSNLPYFPQPSSLPVIQNSINYTLGFEGYPERRYPFPLISDDSGLLSTTLQQPVVTHYNSADWWKRFSRSTGRSKRQATLGPGETSLCPTRSQFIMPKAALNNRGNWMYVVNLEQTSDKYTQLVRSEICISDQCNGICSLPNGYTSRCVQQYVQKRLVALEGSGDRLYTDVFWFPHCCICQISALNSG